MKKLFLLAFLFLSACSVSVTDSLSIEEGQLKQQLEAAGQTNIRIIMATDGMDIDMCPNTLGLYLWKSDQEHGMACLENYNMKIIARGPK